MHRMDQSSPVRAVLAAQVDPYLGAGIPVEHAAEKGRCYWRIETGDSGPVSSLTWALRKKPLSGSTYYSTGMVIGG